MRRAAALVLLAIGLAGGSASVAHAEEPSPAQTPESDLEQQLAERFAPVMMLKQQDEDCDPNGEPYRPTAVDIVLDNPEIALRQVGGSDPVVTRAPSGADLFGLNQGFYLDFPGSSLSPGCIYESDFRKYSGDRTPVVYAHVVQQSDLPDVVFVQYWFYWYYNDWNNKHESDWEGITLKFEASSVEEALAGEPVAVGFSQHEGGERADWDDDKLERDGDHPVVYSSAGSHASYYGSAVYLGRGASEGFGCDTTTGPSDRLEPEVIVLPDAVEDLDDPLAWLGFNGRWGERQSGAFNGPTGPATKARWLEPAPWFDELRDSSVVIPGGESQGSSVINVFCDAVARGSNWLISFKMEPAQVVVGMLIVFGIVWFLIRRTEWDEVEPRPIRRRRRAGQIIRSAVEAYQREPLVFIFFGLVYIPAAIVAGVLGALLELVPFFDTMRATLGAASGTNLVVGLLIGSLVNLAAFVVVNSMVAAYMERQQHGVPAAKVAFADVWHRRYDVLGTFAWTYGIVLALLVTGVGAPIGVFLLVRYQFVPQVVMLEGLDGVPALRRSGRWTRRRWLHTAFVAASLNGLVVLVAVVLGLLLLILVPSLPLWVFSVLASLVYAILVPLSAISMTLLYGDAVAQQERQPAADRVRHDDDPAGHLTPNPA
jgi:hypothetical protein